MENKVIALKEKAKRILGNYDFGIFIGAENILKTLQEIIDNEIQEFEIEILTKTLHNIENYLLTKEQFVLPDDDLSFLRNIARELRNQKVRIEDQAAFSSPIFKVHIDEKDKEKNFSFITRNGAKKYIEYNSTLLTHLPSSDNNVETEKTDRRENTLFDVEYNTNLEMERIIDIIKRNF